MQPALFVSDLYSVCSFHLRSRRSHRLNPRPEQHSPDRLARCPIPDSGVEGGMDAHRHRDLAWAWQTPDPACAVAAWMCSACYSPAEMHASFWTMASCALWSFLARASFWGP
eukprot:1255815-Rhodomonas_salina.1